MSEEKKVSDCESVVRALWDFLDAELDDASAAQIDEHLEAGQPGHYKRYQVICPLCNSGHRRHNMTCSKSRNIGTGQTRSFGRMEPLAYLAVWAERAEQFPSAAAHIAYRPSLADVKAYMLGRGWRTGIPDR